MSNALIPFSDVRAMAKVAADSRMFGFKTPDEALAIMLLCQAENLHPAIAMRDYHVINNRPAIKADAMLARFQQAGGKVEWTTLTDEKVIGVFTHPQGGTVTITWDDEQVKRAELGRNPTHMKYPRQMKRARCISEGIRTVYPGCVVGVYTSEEVADMPPPQPPREVPNVVVEPADEALEYVLYKPDGTEYGRFRDEDEARRAYFRVVDSINANAKIGADDKASKLSAFAAANTHMFPEHSNGD